MENTSKAYNIYKFLIEQEGFDKIQAGDILIADALFEIAEQLKRQADVAYKLHDANIKLAEEISKDEITGAPPVQPASIKAADNEKDSL